MEVAETLATKTEGLERFLGSGAVEASQTILARFGEDFNYFFNYTFAGELTRGTLIVTLGLLIYVTSEKLVGVLKAGPNGYLDYLQFGENAMPWEKARIMKEYHRRQILRLFSKADKLQSEKEVIQKEEALARSQSRLKRLRKKKGKIHRRIEQNKKLIEETRECIEYCDLQEAMD